MEQFPFIFSNQVRYRLLRHLSFWFFWWLFLASLYLFVTGQSTLSLPQRIPNSLADSLIFLCAHIFFSYSLMYFIIPRFVIRSKYAQASLWTALLMVATAAFSALITLYILAPVKQFILPDDLIVKYAPSKKGDLTEFHMALLAGLRGSITVGGIAAAIKLMKHWYSKEKLSLQLKKENAESQLQVLKAQVHPHFLFNTLNNIYAYTQNTSAVASEMICGLSDILRYMLYECDKPLVPLSQELKMVEEYVKLETVRYGNKLDLHIDLPKDTKGYDIAPLLLLPFVENCFKHGTSNMIDQPWINLTVSLNGDDMTMKVLNSKSPAGRFTFHKGIGIANVQKRLSLSYPEKHQLLINEEADVYIVILKLKLTRSPLQLMNANQPALPLAVNN